MSIIQVALQNVEITEKVNEATVDIARNQDIPEPTRTEAETQQTPESKKNNSADSSEEVPSPPAPMAGASTPEQT